MEDIGSVYFRLRRPGERARTHLICTDVKMDGATIFISLNLADDRWPFLIENDSSYPVTFCQMVGPEATICGRSAHYHIGCHECQCRVKQLEAVPNLSTTGAYILPVCMGFPCGPGEKIALDQQQFPSRS
jgi:SHR-binding domain of vacuolar-sorting associated protein 13